MTPYQFFIVRAEHLPEAFDRGAVGPAMGTPATVSTLSRAMADDAELKRLVTTAKLTRRELAQQLGLSERTLYRRLKALGLA